MYLYNLIFFPINKDLSGIKDKGKRQISSMFKYLVRFISFNK
jgi:hypothetical protein